MNVEALDLSEDTPSSSSQGLGQRVRGWFNATYRRLSNRRHTFTRLSGDEDAAESSEVRERPVGYWCPEEAAGFWSRLFYCYVDSLMRLGYSKPLVQEDAWDLAARDDAKLVSTSFADNLNSDPHRGSVLHAIWKQCGKPFMAAGLLKLIHDVLIIASPLFLQQLLKALQDGSSAWVGIALAMGLGLAAMLEALFVNSYFHILFRVSLHLKISLIDMLFAKSLRISSTVKGRYGVGAITNLQSNDAAKLYNLSQYLHMLWSGPLQILVVMGLLVRVLHWIPAACGLLSTAAMIPATIYTSRKLAGIRKQLMLDTDARIKLCNEVVQGIKAIKLYAWEEPYEEKVMALRQKELSSIRRAALWGITNTVLFYGGPIIISLASFAVYSIMGYPLTADVAFVALALFNLLRFPVLMFPNQIMNIINGKVALQRIQKFIAEEEMEQPELKSRAASHQAAVKIQDGSFSWDRQGTPVLEGIDLELLEGQLMMIVGEVGSGKSSLLHALLGEMHACSGAANLSGRVAYTSQDPWIQNASLRDNILMGSEFREDRYAAVLDACALRTDLELLPAGDQSEIGEKGINLSGGQRHRVALARACYAESDVVLLDDPLSAVDAHVGQQLWGECICGLLATKTRVLVTHHMHILPFADLIAVFEGGRITHLGTFEALESEVDFHAFEASEDQEEGKAGPKSSAQPPGDSLQGEEPSLGHPPPELLDGSNDASSSSEGGTRMSPQQESPLNHSPVPGEELETDIVHLSSILSADLDDLHDKGPLTGLDNKEDIILTVEESEKHERASFIPAKLAADEKGRIVKTEERSIGRVQKSVYWTYAKSWGPFWLPMIILLAAVLERTTAVGQNYWLKVWSDATASAEKGVAATDTPFYMSIYFVFGMGSLVLMVARSTSLILGTVIAAKKLHADLLHKVMRMPMSFFDSQPTGRLLNRFSRDTEALDTSLGNTVSSFLTCAVSVLGALLVVLAVTPGVLFAVVPLSFAYRYIQQVYLATSRELKRLDSLAMSPIFGHFSESISGLLTLRAFRKQQLSTEQNYNKLNNSNRIYWLMQNVNRWLSVRLELLGISVVFATAVAVTAFPTNPGLAGLALTSALNLTGLMNWMVRMNSELEVSMNSVERMIEYLPMESEAPAVIEDNRPPEGWPSQGAIQVQDLVVRYRPDLPAVIQGLSFSTRKREKIGVAGRTGCGKSTLMMALYRIVEPNSGCITIDGIDLSTIGLADLRSRLALVPQDPVIFSGTVRSNLDPFSQAQGDADIWSALKQAGLADMVKALPKGLESNLSEAGGNVSTGQRQLLCMARALLRQTRILVLDEATSNVDPATDALIQKTIRSAFAECTTLTIAHRIHTIMDSDRILILGAGQLLEFDSPKALMKNPASAFSRLLGESRRTHSRRSSQAI